MRKNIPTRARVIAVTSTVALAVLLSRSVQSQELRLFEPIEGDPAQAVPAGPEQPFMQAGNGQPAYTLRSVSRFGDQYQAVFVDRSGQTVKATWTAGQTAAIPNSGFSIVAAGPSTVSLMHPAGDNCVAAELAGVRCSAANQAELHLSVAAPLASNGAPQAVFNQGFTDNGNAAMGPTAPAGFFNDGVVGTYPPGVDPAQNGQQVFINPFSGEPEVMPQVPPEELAQRQQRQEVRAARLRQFEQQQRIDDADIPAGMQRVRTPFGDRLMPIRE